MAGPFWEGFQGEEALPWERTCLGGENREERRGRWEFKGLKWQPTGLDSPGPSPSISLLPPAHAYPTPIHIPHLPMS